MSKYIRIPEPKKYNLLYYKPAGNSRDGVETMYIVSLPIAKSDTCFTAYCFNRKGVRSFKYDRVLSMKQVIMREELVSAAIPA